MSDVEDESTEPLTCGVCRKVGEFTAPVSVILVFAPIDRIVRVSLRTVAFEVPPQDVLVGNVSVHDLASSARR